MLKGMKKLVLVGIFLILSSSALAGSTWTQEVGYGDRMRGKFLFGFANFNGGWLSLIQEPVESVQNHKNIFVGVGKGLAFSVLNTVGGLAHFLTFPVTVVDIPLPRNGVDL